MTAPKRITLTAEQRNLAPLIEAVEDWLTGAGFEHRQVMGACVATEEIFINICCYAYTQGGDVTISLALTGDKAEIELRDRGRPFNPLNHSSPNIATSLADHKEGGLGIYMARKLVDRMYYRQVEGDNILTIEIDKKTEVCDGYCDE